MAIRSSAAGLSLVRYGLSARQIRHFTAYASIREQSNTAGSSSMPPSTHSAAPQSNVPPHRRSTGPPSNHKLFYRDIVPPLFRVLAYGSAVFLSLQLIWQYLDGREQKQLENQVRIEMEAQVRQKLESRGVIQSDSSAQGKGWWSWIRGQ